MRHAAVIAALAGAITTGGCTSSAAIRTWQKSVETYIDEHGNGDPNVLRSVADDPVAKDFGLLGAQHAGVPFMLPSRTDVRSLVLGHREQDDRYWFIFMVAVVRYHGAFTDFPLQDTQVLDLRPAAMCAESGVYEWRLARRDIEALDVYIEPQVERWRKADDDRERGSRPWTTFPTPADDWTLETSPDGVTITERRSGATWVLRLDGDDG